MLSNKKQKHLRLPALAAFVLVAFPNKSLVLSRSLQAEEDPSRALFLAMASSNGGRCSNVLYRIDSRSNLKDLFYHAVSIFLT